MQRRKAQLGLSPENAVHCTARFLEGILSVVLQVWYLGLTVHISQSQCLWLNLWPVTNAVLGQSVGQRLGPSRYSPDSSIDCDTFVMIIPYLGAFCKPFRNAKTWTAICQERWPGGVSREQQLGKHCSFFKNGENKWSEFWLFSGFERSTSGPEDCLQALK